MVYGYTRGCNNIIKCFYIHPAARISLININILCLIIFPCNITNLIVCIKQKTSMLIVYGYYRGYIRALNGTRMVYGYTRGCNNISKCSWLTCMVSSFSVHVYQKICDLTISFIHNSIYATVTICLLISLCPTILMFKLIFSYQSVLYLSVYLCQSK